MKDLKVNLRLLVIAVGVVLVWRGVWGFADLFLFPNNLLLSFSFSIILGLIILIFNHEKLNDLF